MPRSFQEIIRLVQNGDPVDSSLNVILRQLAGNSEYLKTLLDESLLGQAVMAREVTVHEDVKVGQPVYFNATTQQLEQAIASASVSNDGELLTNESTQVWGVCHYKHNSTKADVLLYGYATVDTSESISDTVAGLYYLSATSPGKLVRQVPPVTVPVLYWDGDTKIYVNPNFNNAFLQHQHYKFALQAVPAGVNVIVPTGQPHVIVDADTTVEGWLPAGHASFNGTAPEGAKFGYNLSASALNNVWPPLPLNGATISWLRPVSSTPDNAFWPAMNLAYFSAADTFTVSANDIYTLVVDLSSNSGGFGIGDSVIVTLNRATFTALGLVIQSVEITDTDEVTIVLANNTDADIEFDDIVKVDVTHEIDRLFDGNTDFKEDTVPEDLVLIDNNGIWWMTDCYGRVPWPPEYGAASEDSVTAAAVFAATERGITRHDADGVFATAYGVNAWDAADVAMHPILRRAYFTRTSGTIESTDPQAVDQVPEVVATATEPIGLDIDLDNDHIYFTDNDGPSIHRINLDGTGDTVILTGLSSAGGIRVDSGNGYLYFVDGAKIRRCDLDGDNETDIITGLNTPRFLAIDPTNDHLYWTDSGTNKVSRSTLAGASITDLITGVDAVGIDVDLDNSYIYFTTESDTKLQRATLAGASVTVLETFESWSVPGGVRWLALPAMSVSSCATVDMGLTCWFTKMQFQSASTVVTSLRAVDGSGLTITCVQDNSAATTGDLQIDFDPEFLVDPDITHAGHIVIKTFEDKTFKRGPVVESIIVDSDYILGTSTATDGNELQGVVTLSFTPTPTGSELPIEMVRLNNVEEEFYEDVLGLGFRQDIDAEFRAKVNIPATIEADVVRIRLRFVMLARAAGDLPAFTLTARNVTRPGTTTATAETLPTTDSAVTLSTADAAGMAEDDYVEIVSAEITTAPGDFVLFTLGREGSGDSFAGDIHVIDQRAVISSIA